jgi:hypothetical protein
MSERYTIINGLIILRSIVRWHASAETRSVWRLMCAVLFGFAFSVMLFYELRCNKLGVCGLIGRRA